MAKVNIDENPRIAREHRVRSIPMLMVLRKGELVEQHLNNFTQKWGPRTEAQLLPDACVFSFVVRVVLLLLSRAPLGCCRACFAEFAHLPRAQWPSKSGICKRNSRL